MTAGKWFKYGLLTLAVFLMMAFAGAACNIISIPFFAANKAAEGTKMVISRTLNGDNILSNYENFKDMYEGAKQQVANIKKQRGSLEELQVTYGEDAKQWPKDVRENASFIRQTIDGLNMQYQNIVARYNADSKKQNRNLFKSKDLPYQLPTDPDELENTA